MVAIAYCIRLRLTAHMALCEWDAGLQGAPGMPPACYFQQTPCGGERLECCSEKHIPHLFFLYCPDLARPHVVSQTLLCSPVKSFEENC